MGDLASLLKVERRRAATLKGEVGMMGFSQKKKSRAGDMEHLVKREVLHCCMHAGSTF